MSCRRTEKTFQKIEIKIDTLTNQDLIKIEDTIELALNQKITKLTTLLQNTNNYCYDNCLVVNDRYNITRDLEEIVKAFGMNIICLDCNLKGKTYLITDSLTDILKQINVEYEFAKELNNFEITEDIHDLIKHSHKKFKKNLELEKIINNIRLNKSYIAEKTIETTSTYEDYLLLNEEKTETYNVDISKVNSQINSFINSSNLQLNKVNQDMQNGTSKLIYSRAKQMGYAVQEIKKNNQIEGAFSKTLSSSTKSHLHFSFTSNIIAKRSIILLLYLFFRYLSMTILTCEVNVSCLTSYKDSKHKVEASRAHSPKLKTSLL